jgi:tetratricopeptide (TPR) repeat protein
MLSGDLEAIEPKLDEARALLSKDHSSRRDTGLAAHYDEALFELQVAICYCVAGVPQRSLALYDRWLNEQLFSRRDFGYFLSLKSEAFAAAEEPDEASRAGLEAVSLARETSSARTYQEVLRLVDQLQPWRDREPVRQLREAVLA